MNDLGTNPMSYAGDALMRLLREREAIEQTIISIERNGIHDESESDSLAELAASSQHPADVASETLEREVEFGLIADLRVEHVEVEAALARLRDGVYGRCVQCHDHIDVERLQVMPAADRCRRCQAAAERPRGLHTETCDAPALEEMAEFLPADDVTDADESTWMEVQAMRIIEAGA